MSSRRRSPTFSGDDLSDEEVSSKQVRDKTEFFHGNDSPHLRSEVDAGGGARQGDVHGEVQRFSLDDSDDEKSMVPAQKISGTAEPQPREGVQQVTIAHSEKEATSDPLIDGGVQRDGYLVDLTAPSRVGTSAVLQQERESEPTNLPGPGTLEMDGMHGLAPSCRTPQTDDHLAGESTTGSGAQIFSMADSEPGTPKEDSMSDHDFLLGAPVEESPVGFGTRILQVDGQCVSSAGGGAQQFSMADSDDDVPCEQAETCDLLLDGSPDGFAAPEDEMFL
jgi:hypothetical protein